MKDRIKQIMEAQHMSQQVFAGFIGTTSATLSGIFNERTRPTLSIVEAIKKKIPDINTDWLMFGSGSMYSSSPATSEPDANASAQPLQPSGQPKPSSEAVLDFGEFPSSPQRPVVNVPQAHVDSNGVRNTPASFVPERVKYIDKPPRRVTEIRVYYDDQTWESFVPSKK